MKKITRMIIASLLLAGSFACGDNAFELINTEDPAEEASKALEQGNQQEAINILTDALGSEYTTLYLQMGSEIEAGNTETIRSELENTVADLIASGSPKDVPALVSILSSAHAKLYGIDPLDLALTLATGATSSEGETALTTIAEQNNEIALLFPVLPEATTENINGLSGARLILDSMGEANFTQADFFKKALYLTANVSLLTKQLDQDLDGEISPLEAANMSGNNAELVLDLLLDATTSILTSGETEGDSNAAASAEKIAQIRETILNSEGSDDAEKLKNYLGSQSISPSEDQTLP